MAGCGGAWLPGNTKPLFGSKRVTPRDNVLSIHPRPRTPRALTSTGIDRARRRRKGEAPEEPATSCPSSSSQPLPRAPQRLRRKRRARSSRFFRTLQEQERVLVQCIEILGDGRRRGRKREGQRDGCKKCDFAHVSPQSKHRIVRYASIDAYRVSIGKVSDSPNQPSQARAGHPSKPGRLRFSRLNWPLKPPP